MAEKKIGDQTYKEVSLSELEGETGGDAFASWGFARVKVSRGDEILAVKIRVRSVPHELLEALRKSAPKPPSKTVMLDPKNPDHAALGATTRQKAIIPDFNDADYVEKADAHQRQMTYEVVGRGVDETLKLRDGSPADTPAKVYKALEERGLSGTHFTEIAGTIMRLTDWSEEERENFLMKP